MSARIAGPGVLAVLACVSVSCAPASDRPFEVTEPVTLAASGASNPTVASGPNGTSYVAWVGLDGGTSNVFLSTIGPDGQPLGDPVRVNDVPGDAHAHGQAPAQVATAGDTVWVVWSNSTPVAGRRFPASDLRMARSTDQGRSFAPAVTVNDDAGAVAATHTFHDAITTGTGALVVSWLDSRERWQAVADAMGWRPGDPPPGDADVDAHGGGTPEDGPEIRVAVSTDGGRAFEPSRVVDGGSCPCCRTRLAAGPGGALWVAWRKIHEGSVRDVVVARSDDLGASWGEAIRVHDDGWVFDGCPHAGPGIAVGRDGTLHVTWYTGREGGTGLFYASSTDGGRSFSKPVALVARDFVPPAQARLAPAEGGRATVAWEDRDVGGEPLVRLATVSAEGLGEALVWPGSSPELGGAEPRALTWLDGEQVKVVMIRSR